MNKVMLIGRLTKDVELKTINENMSVAKFTLAVDRRFKKEGEQQTDFIPIVAWNKTAEFCNNYFRKGLRVAVFGRIQARSWDDDEGKKHYATEVVAYEVAFADGKQEQVQQQSQQNNGFYPLPGDEDDELPF